MKYLALVLLVKQTAGLAFSAPFKQSGFEVSGDSRIGDKVVDLVHGKNQKGAVWAKDAVFDSEFTLEAVMRSAADSNTEVGKSGFAIWYTSKQLATGDLHGGPSTWDGLVIMIDSLTTGGGGSVRGHLNDGSTNFWNIKNLDSESLSLCRIDYRNALGPITVRMGYSEKYGFVVDVNGQKCFFSTEIALPKGYFFGISANSDTAGDTLSIERLESSQGLKPDLRKHLPLYKQKQPLKPREEVSHVAAEQAEKQTSQQAPQVQPHAKPLDGVTIDDIKTMIEPAFSKVEIVNMKMGQVQSVVDQLVETLTLSMNQVTEMGSKDGSATSGNSKEIAALQKEVQGLQHQIIEWRKQTAEMPREVLRSNPLWLVLAVMLPSQCFAVVIYHSWLRRRDRHEKLL